MDHLINKVNHLKWLRAVGVDYYFLDLTAQPKNLISTKSNQLTTSPMSQIYSESKIVSKEKNSIKSKVEDANINSPKNINHQVYQMCIRDSYISYKDINYMSPETLKYEPNLALFAENNGLAAYHIIAKHARKFLKEHGKIFLEIGFNQAEMVKEIFSHYHYIFKQIYRDLGTQDRVLLFIAPS